MADRLMLNIRCVFALGLLFNNVQAHAADRAAVVVIPAEWKSAIQPWLIYRLGQGYRIAVIEPDIDATATRKKIIAATRQFKVKQPFIVLGADAPPINSLTTDPVYISSIPTFYMPSSAVINFGGESEIATDYPYGDLNGDGISECPVGRIPANNPTQLQSILQRTISYETQAVPGEWLHRMDLIAGIGGFSIFADMAIAGFTKALLTEALPPEYLVTMTQASRSSAYFPAASNFRNVVVDRLNSGSLLWVYVGHGNVEELDQIYEVDAEYPILSCSDADTLNTQNSGSIAILLSCYAGAIDARQACLAETLVRQGHGPIAAIASSRVSMPYGMGVLAKEMLHETFASHTATLGEIVSEAKQTVALKSTSPQNSPLDNLIDGLASALTPADHDIVQERLEHLWLLNLIGDPTLLLHQSESIEVAVSSDGTHNFTLTGNVRFDGELSVQCYYQRGAMPKAAIELMRKSGHADSIGDAELHARYLSANEVVIYELVQSVEAGPFSVTLELPPETIGSFQVRASVYGQSKSAIGAAKIKLK